VSLVDGFSKEKPKMSRGFSIFGEGDATNVKAVINPRASRTPKQAKPTKRIFMLLILG
jgi:hypothetical protein